ncbi:MAG: hypothetical protein ACKO3T_11665 [Planctomycetaceae bacterium]
MLKRLITGTAAAALAGTMLLGSDASSYVKTVGSNVREAVRQEISVEFELDRIRNEVGDLLPEIKKHLKTVASQSVDVKDLERDIAAREASLAQQKDAILTLRKDLEAGHSNYTYRTVSYSRAEVEADLAHRFASFCTAEDCVKRDHQILTAQRDTLRANQRKLDTMLSRKQDLAVKIAQLEARLRQVQAAEAINSMQVDDSQLAQVEQLIRDVGHALDVRESMLETEGQVLGRIPVEEASQPAEPTDLLGDIDRHFQRTQPAPEKSAESGNGSGPQL